MTANLDSVTAPEPHESPGDFVVDAITGGHAEGLPVSITPVANVKTVQQAVTAIRGELQKAENLLQVPMSVDLDATLSALQESLDGLRKEGTLPNIPATLVFDLDKQLGDLREALLATEPPLNLPTTLKIDEMQEQLTDLQNEISRTLEPAGTLIIPSDFALERSAADFASDVADDLSTASNPTIEVELQLATGSDIRSKLAAEIGADTPVPLPIALTPNPSVDDFVRSIENALDTVDILVEFQPENGRGRGWHEGSLPSCTTIARFFFDFGKRNAEQIVCSEYVGDLSQEPVEGFNTFGELPDKLSRCVQRLTESPIDVISTELDERDQEVQLTQRHIEDLIWPTNRDPRERQQLVIVGYADSTGAEHVNSEVALARAQALRDLIDPASKLSRLSTIGRGEEARLPDSNQGLSLENRLSRRVDVLHCAPNAKTVGR